MSEKVCIFGAGELGKSVYQLICNMGYGADVDAFLETIHPVTERQIYGIDVKHSDYFDVSNHRAVLAIAMPSTRAAVARLLPPKTKFASYIHPDVFKLASSELKLGEGSIVFPQVYFSRNISIGAHAVIMPGTVVGHDINIGDFFSTSANVSLGGGITLGDEVFCGLATSVRDQISICDRVVLGMSCAVTRDITEAGTYIGCPAIRVPEK